MLFALAVYSLRVCMFIERSWLTGARTSARRPSSKWNFVCTGALLEKAHTAKTLSWSTRPDKFGYRCVM